MTGYLDAMRSTLAEIIGERDRVVALALPDNLSPAVAPVVSDAVEQLIAFQGRRYARLYLDRIGRFAHRRDVGDALLIEIAQLLAMRMAYEDPIRIAQLALAEAAIGPDGVATNRVDRKCRFRIDELVSALPIVVADPMLDVIGALGWQRLPVKMRFNATGWLGIRRLRIESWLRRWRMLSIRYAKERIWVERWLHMIDRCLAKRPEAVWTIVQSATMIRGYGDPYLYGMANWTLIIDSLVKPVFAGALTLPDLSAAIAEARTAALPDRRQTALKSAIAAIRTRASAGTVPASAMP
ncbi:DUF6537 domain-containing protein [Rhodopseudomonas pseudopalustris]|uniref:DUF6537 domain-containing protein n=1 Tax=Rhodopseudomonas pseudopalustris TaxID=1513892 RepID=A0A1H8QXS6_9BRAD|nr:DUF6537 domain-containing protein [Rhodopseudomonas pseudopalustris]SEO58513.1 hypothetical protein SAMN05444123_103390 [Rhodopseudomonas pseudopalustris]